MDFVQYQYCHALCCNVTQVDFAVVLLITQGSILFCSLVLHVQL